MEGPPFDQHDMETLRKLREDNVHSGNWGMAAKYARVIADELPEDASEQRAASEIFLRSEEISEALRYAQRAVRVAPDVVEYHLHAGVLLNRMENFSAAIAILLETADLAPELPEVYAQLVTAFRGVGDLVRAEKVAQKAWSLDPNSEHHSYTLAWLYEQSGAWDDAIHVMQTFMAQRSEVPPEAHRKLSGHFMQNQQLLAALAEIDAAIEADATLAEYHIHRSCILLEMGEREAAEESVSRAVELDSNNLSARRHLVTVLIENGNTQEALRRGAELLSLRPEDPEYASCMRHLLDAQSMAGTTVELVQIAEMKRAAPPRPAPPRPSFWRALNVQIGTLFALALRDIRSRHGESKLSFVWVLTEPVIHIGVLAIVFQYTMKGVPPIGDNFFLFYFTGVLPYLLISHLISHLGHAVRSQKVLMQIPRVSPMDLLLARVVVEAFTTGVVFFLFIGMFAMTGTNAVPPDPITVLAGFGLTLLLGTGTGLIFAAVAEFSRIGEQISSLLLRFLYFASGVFYVPHMMPLQARETLIWNPFLHVVDYVRLGYFPYYDPFWLDLKYALTCAVVSVVIGLSLVTILRRKMRMIQ